MIEPLKMLLIAFGAVIVLIVGGILVFTLLGWINLGLMMLCGWALSWLPGARSPESERRAIEQRMARLRNPQFGVLAAHFGAPVPESLRRLYQAVDLLEQEDFRLADPDEPDPEDGYYISQFLPADSKALQEIGWEFEEPLLPFAEDGFGNCYCVLFQGAEPASCPVYFWDHEVAGTLDEMRIADSLDEFLARPRRPGAGAVEEQN